MAVSTKPYERRRNSLAMDITHTRSKTDLKEYKIVTLACGLEVLAVSSLGRSHAKSAAAMSVQVGSFSDPVEAEGCAHFLEHMVFMGSEKYPQENHYDSFVSSHGGSCNAFTEGEHTVYQFDINTEHFSSAIDIFAQCFIAPLLSFASSDREIEAIESEFNIARMDDYNRWQQSLFSACDKNPIAKQFSWGNKKSLVDVPKKYGLNMQELLKAFHKLHYRPENMKLVVISPKYINEILSIVESSFASWKVEPMPMPSVPSKDTRNKKKSRREPLLLPQYERLAKFANVLPSSIQKIPYVNRISPIKRSHKVTLAWQLPSVTKLYRTKPLQIISHCLGYEGKGSLLSALKELGYAYGLSAGLSGSNMEDNTMFSIFSVSASLTVKGLANWHRVVKLIHTYIDIMNRAPQEEFKRVFDESLTMDRIRFDYMDEEEEEDFVERLAVCMLPYYAIDRMDLLSATSITPDWDYSALVSMLRLMSPDAARIDLMSASFTRPNDIGESSADDEEDDCDDEDDEEDENDDRSSENQDSENDEDDQESLDKEIEVVNDDKLKTLYLGPESWLPLICRPCSEVKYEPYFSTPYWQDAIPSDLSEFLASPDNIDTAIMTLPPPNSFIPRELSLLKATPSSGEVVPDVLFSSDGLRVWHLCDVQRYPVPKSSIILRLTSQAMQSRESHTHQSVLSYIYHDLSILVLRDVLNETIYAAAMADLSCDIRDSGSIGITIEVSGFSDRAPAFALLVLSAYLNLADILINGMVFENISRFTEESFERVLESLSKTYSNSDIKASSAATNSRRAVLSPTIPSQTHRYEYLASHRDEVTIATLAVHTQRVLSHCCVEALLQGNVSRDGASDFAKSLSDLLHLQSLNIRLSDDANKLVDVTSFAAARTPNSISSLLVKNRARSNNEENVCVQAYFQLGRYSLLTETQLDMLDILISEPYFDDLRTKQQLGYSVSCYPTNTFNVLGYCFSVLSSSYSISHIQSSIMAFVHSLEALLRDMADDNFHAHRLSLISKRRQPHISLQESAIHNYQMIESKIYNFTCRNDQAGLLEDTSIFDKEAMIAFTKEHFTNLLTRKLVLVHADAPNKTSDVFDCISDGIIDVSSSYEAIHQFKEFQYY